MKKKCLNMDIAILTETKKNVIGSEVEGDSGIDRAVAGICMLIKKKTKPGGLEVDMM